MLTEKMLSVVVVCYRDAGSIHALYERLSKTLASVAPSYEIIYVNDASPDDAEPILRALAEKDLRLTVIHQARNFGAQAAFTAGMVQAMGDAVILMDGDLQDPPELIVDFVKKWQEGYDVVYGIRRKRERSMGRWTAWLYHLFYVLFNRLSYMRIPLDAGEFSLMDRNVVDRVNALPERDRLIRGLRAWVGFRQTGIEYVRPERYAGRSTNSVFRNTRWARKAICSFSYAPLEWVSYLATFMVLLSIAGMAFYIVTFFAYPDVPRGLTTIFVLVLFLGSIQLLSLGVIAEYIGRIFEETKQRPRYVTREIQNDHRKR
ncbi:glycosyltransferase family 2 protein [Candidatus Peregrinibacteria bacterium]|nr:glycosyltransferase family 2 protein [Candidatus Peregrinibacteria bacterium]